jgi:hypothetical protein
MLPHQVVGEAPSDAFRKSWKVGMLIDRSLDQDAQEPDADRGSAALFA